jgi:hypothetical protein
VQTSNGEYTVTLVGILIVVHIANVPVEAVLAFNLVWAHGAGKLRFDPTLVALMLDKSTTSRVAPTAAWAHIRFVLDQGC